jgi:hypothetical protein
MPSVLYCYFLSSHNGKSVVSIQLLFEGYFPAVAFLQDQPVFCIALGAADFKPIVVKARNYMMLNSTFAAKALVYLYARRVICTLRVVFLLAYNFGDAFVFLHIIASL